MGIISTRTVWLLPATPSTWRPTRLLLALLPRRSSRRFLLGLGLGRWRGSRRDRQDLEEMPKAALLGFFLWRHRPPNHPGAQSYPLGMEGSRVERILRLTPVCWN